MPTEPPTDYAGLTGDEACKMLQSLVLERGGPDADWERAEAELAIEFPKLTAAVKEHEAREANK